MFLSLHVSVSTCFEKGSYVRYVSDASTVSTSVGDNGMFLFNTRFYYNKVYFHKNTFSLKKQKIQSCFFWGEGGQR